MPTLVYTWIYNETPTFLQKFASELLNCDCLKYASYFCEETYFDYIFVEIYDYTRITNKSYAIESRGYLLSNICAIKLLSD